MWKTPCKKEPMLPVSHQRIGETYVHTIQPHTRERRKHPYLAYRMFWNTPDLLHSEDYPGFPTDAEEITDLTVRCASTCMWKGTVMGSRDRADFRMYVNRRIKERYGDIMSTSWITALSYLKRIPSVNRQISLSGRNMPRVWFLCVLLADKFCDDVTKSWCMTDWSYMAGNICPVSWWRNNERALRTDFDNSWWNLGNLLPFHFSTWCLSQSPHPAFVRRPSTNPSTQRDGSSSPTWPTLTLQLQRNLAGPLSAIHGYQLHA